MVFCCRTDHIVIVCV